MLTGRKALWRPFLQTRNNSNSGSLNEKRIRQELVQALSLHKFQREMLVMQNHIE
jgi:hypothetical protein